MLTIFDSHNLRMAAQRIAAAADDDAITIADARAMHKHLADVIAAHEQATSSAARRAAKLDKALSDPARQPAIQYAAGALRRLGLDFVAASDANKLTDAMRSLEGPPQRLRLDAHFFRRLSYNGYKWRDCA